jgi:hypothetical protein
MRYDNEHYNFDSRYDLNELREGFLDMMQALQCKNGKWVFEGKAVESILEDGIEQLGFTLDNSESESPTGCSWMHHPYTSYTHPSGLKCLFDANIRTIEYVLTNWAPLAYMTRERYANAYNVGDSMPW